MKFTIGRDALLRELAYIQQTVADKKSGVPALACVRLEASGKRVIRLSGTDLDQSLTCETEGAVQKAGACALPARKLLDIVKQLPNAEIVFESKDRERVSVTCERSNFRIAGLDAKEMPDLPKFKEAAAQLPADILHTMIERTRFCITQEESRYTLSGAKFIVRKKGVRMVTTDGHRLALIDNKTIVNERELDVLIPKNTLVAVARLAVAHEGEIGFACDENLVYFEIGSRTLVARTLVGQFPNYEMILPKKGNENPHKVRFECAELLQAVRRVAVMAEDRTRKIRLEFAPNRLRIVAEEDEQGAAEETLEIGYAGEDMTIGINANYLGEYLAVIGSGAVSLEFKSPKDAVLVRPMGEPGFNSLSIVMPLYLEEVKAMKPEETVGREEVAQAGESEIEAIAA